MRYLLVVSLFCAMAGAQTPCFSQELPIKPARTVAFTTDEGSREIRYVMKEGVLYDGDTLDEVWPEPKKCPEWRLKNTQ